MSFAHVLLIDKMRSKIVMVIAFFLVALLSTGVLSAATIRPSILLIGDSNTENGDLSGALQKMFCDTFGYTGSGYFPLIATWGARPPYKGYSPTFTVSYTTADFTQYDSYDNWIILTPPYLAPSGLWITNKTTNATVSVPFVGQSLDVYWASGANGGSFDIKIDGTTATTVNTSNAVRKSNKTTVTNIATGNHTFSAVVTSGTVVLQGLDIMPNATGTNARPVVHNWGNSWICSQQMLDVDTTILATSLQAVNPDMTIIMVGTNDDGLAGVIPAATFKANLITYINRVKKALPLTTVLVMSCVTRCGDYVGGAYPQAAAATGVNYWDMNAWFNANVTNGIASDGLHFSASGGQATAVELWKRIKVMMGTALAPIVTPASSVFTDSIVVSMSTGTPGATVRYTTNNTNPTSASAAYTGPITIKSTTTIKAGAFKTNMDSSAVTTAVFTKVGAGSLTKIRYYARTGFGYRLAGGIFEGTNGDPATGPYTTLTTIGNGSYEGQWNEITSFTNIDPGYRYLRYKAPGGSYGNICEIEFYRGGSSTKLSGTPFGTPGSYNNNGYDYTYPFDGNIATYFDYTTADGAYTGLDLGTTSTTSSPWFHSKNMTNSSEKVMVFRLNGTCVGQFDHISDVPLLRMSSNVCLVKYSHGNAEKIRRVMIAPR